MRKRFQKGGTCGYHYSQDIDAVKTGVSCWHSWSVAVENGVSTYNQSQGIEFVPMFWNNNFTIETVLTQIPIGAKYLLAFNDPNFNGEANMPLNRQWRHGRV